MKALSKIHAKPGLWMTDDPKPKMGRSDVMVKIHKTAICGTDLHIYNWDSWAQKTIAIPTRTGHEFVGEIIDIGEDVRGFKVGDRVSGEGHLTCGQCRSCRAGRRHLCRNTIGFGVQSPGAFGEYFALPEANTFKVPDDISDDIAAIFDPLGNAVHAALEFDVTAEDVLVTGAGPVGLMSASICKHSGARNVVITDINPYRLELAKKMGLHAVNPQEQSLKDVMQELKMTEGFDVGLEMSGSPQAFKEMIKAMNYGGNIAYMGIPEGDFSINWHDIVFKSITIKGLYGRQIFDTWHKMACMISSGLDVTPVITHHFKVDDFQKGFDAMLSGKAGKVILNWE
ncbi:MAG: L-threonine 3-dehydrogenase [Legionellaceae bacterium]|nr:L-threonine 3-dehydrogenase [Legionellaceae bacterium]